MINRLTMAAVSLGLASWAAAQEESSPVALAMERHSAWLETDGLRAAWLSYKQIDDDMVQCLSNARINTVFLKHGFHDLLALETARWEGDQLVVDARDSHLSRMIENTHRAAAGGIHVLWLANYELDQMLPHLRRLGYQSAAAEGPSRYLKNGKHDDAAPLDPVFWRGLTGAHGALVAQLSMKHPIDGLLYDTEHYAGGIMYLQNSGYSDATFQKYIDSRSFDASADTVPSGTRYRFLKSSGRLPDYHLFLEEQAYGQARQLAKRWHAINPHLVVGIWPLLDNWFSRGTLRGLGGAVPALGLSGVEYYHGADQSKSLAEFFETRCPNVHYVPGFYPPYAYTAEQLGQHVAQALRSTSHYWMLGPHQELEQPEYQSALRKAFETSGKQQHLDHPNVALHYEIVKGAVGPQLVARLSGVAQDESPLLSLHAAHGGGTLCADQPMESTDAGYHARIPLRRRITNNRHLAGGFRSGASYSYSPTPREYLYEDVSHTKLIDGRAYGFFGTSVAWAREVAHASVTFDLHRAYRVVQVELAQPNKMDDRIGGPARLSLSTADAPNSWEKAAAFEPHFPIALKDVTEPDTVAAKRFDKRHDRAWLSWQVLLDDRSTRWLRIDLERVRDNSSLTLGEVSVWALFEGEVIAAVELDGKRLSLETGRRWTVAVPR